MILFFQSTEANMFEKIFRSRVKPKQPLTQDQIIIILEAALTNMNKCSFWNCILQLCGPFRPGTPFPTPKIGYMYWLYYVVRVRVMNSVNNTPAFEKSMKVLDNQIQDDIMDMDGDLDYFTSYVKEGHTCMSKKDPNYEWVFWHGRLTWSSVLYGELSLTPNEKHQDWNTYFNKGLEPMAMMMPTQAASQVCQAIEPYLI
jgi:hypothetical protein